MLLNCKMKRCLVEFSSSCCSNTEVACVLCLCDALFEYLFYATFNVEIIRIFSKYKHRTVFSPFACLDRSVIYEPRAWARAAPKRSSWSWRPQQRLLRRRHQLHSLRQSSLYPKRLNLKPCSQSSETKTPAAAIFSSIPIELYASS